MKAIQELFLFLAFFSFLSNVKSQISPYVPTNGLVAFFPFNGNANDESGNGHNGVVTGASRTSDRFGIIDASLVFDGVNDQIATTSSSEFELANNKTMSVWIYTNLLPCDDKGIVANIGTSGSLSGHTGYLLLQRGLVNSNLFLSNGR